MGQANGFSFVCTTRCFFAESLFAKRHPHTSHLWQLTAVFLGFFSKASVVPSQVPGSLSIMAESPEVPVLLVSEVTETILGSRTAGSNGPFPSMSTGPCSRSSNYATAHHISLAGGSVAGGLLGSTLMLTAVTTGGSMAGGLLGDTVSTLVVSLVTAVLASPCIRCLCTLRLLFQTKDFGHRWQRCDFSFECVSTCSSRL